MKNLGEYHDLYVQRIHYCLQMYLKTLEISVLKYMNLVLLTFCLHQNYSRNNPALLTDIDMLLMVEKGIRGRICQEIHRHANANNKYMKNYNKDIISSYLRYLDVNSLYG